MEYRTRVSVFDASHLDYVLDALERELAYKLVEILREKEIVTVETVFKLPEAWELDQYNERTPFNNPPVAEARLIINPVHTHHIVIPEYQYPELKYVCLPVEATTKQLVVRLLGKAKKKVLSYRTYFTYEKVQADIEEFCGR